MLMVVVNGRQQMVGFAGLLMETIAGMAFPGQSPSTMVVQWKYGTGGGQLAAGQFMQPIMGMEFVVTDTGGAPPMAAPPTASPAASPAASYASHAAPAASGWPLSPATYVSLLVLALKIERVALGENIMLEFHR